MDDAIVIAQYDKPTRARAMKTALEDAGIAVDLLDEQTVGADPLLAKAVGGVKLRVAESDADRAREIVEGGRDGTLDDSDFPDDVPFEDLDEDERKEWDEMTQGLHCPECGHDSIGLDPAALVGGLVLAFGVPVVSHFLLGTGAFANLAIGGSFLIVAQILLFLRLFPLACKECHHGGPRGAFDPSTS